MAKQPQNRGQVNSGALGAPQLQQQNPIGVDPPMVPPENGVTPIGRRMPPEAQSRGQQFLGNHPGFASNHPNFQQNHPGMFNGNK
jgi:hypothetical protein